jgi:hypothetical protein
LLTNLNILLKLDYYGRTMICEFKYFIKFDYYDVTIVGKFNYFIMTELWLVNLNILLSLIIMM